MAILLLIKTPPFALITPPVKPRNSAELEVLLASIAVLAFSIQPLFVI